MKVFVRKGEKESNERLITRFNKAVQASRKVPKIRGARYHKKSATKRQMRGAAIMREHYRAIRARKSYY